MLRPSIPTFRSMPRSSVRIGRLIHRFFTNRRGVAAVEFAIILPLMLLIYVGTIDVTRAVMASRKIDIVSRTISDIVAQQSTTTTVPTSTIATIFDASSAIMQPYSTSDLTMTVSGLSIKAQTSGTCCDVKVTWSYTQGGTLRPCNVNLTQVDPATPPAATNVQKGLVTANTQAGYVYSTSGATYLIVTDVRYVYQPFFLQAVSWLAGGFQKTTYMVPRSQSGQITLTNASAAETGQSGAICS